MAWTAAAVWFVASCGLMGVGVIVGVWGVVGDRSRGRRRCAGCWYDMKDAAGLVCPECGRAARSERGLFRARWSRRSLAVGVAAVGVGAYVMQASVRMGPAPWREGWTAWVPTTVVVMTAPVERAPQNALAKAVWQRSRDMWRWQEAVWARREIRAASDADLIEWLHVRRVWPAGQVMPLRLYAVEPFPTLAGPRLMVVRSVDGAGVRMCATIDSWDTRSLHGQCRAPDWIPADAGSGEFELPAMEVGRHEFELEMTLSGRWGASRSVRHTLVVEVKPAGPEVITPVSTPELDKVVAASLRAEFWPGPVKDHEWDDRSVPHARITMDDQFIFDSLYRGTYPAARGKTFPDPAVAVVLRVMDGERVVCEVRIQDYGWTSSPGSVDEEIKQAAWDDAAHEWRAEVLDRLVVNVRGDLSLAVKSLSSPRYWSGEINVPLRAVMGQTPIDRR